MEIRTPRVLLFELNEFNKELLKSALSGGNLPGIQRLLSLPQVMTLTKDTYDSDRLEPWVQWVNVHTGHESLEHGVRHLGDVTKLKHDQIWETLSGAGVSSGIWGVLNGSRGKSPECRFFFPDPWTFSEEAFPKKLNRLLEFPRYLATNRVSPSILTLGTTFLKFSTVLLKPFIALKFLKNLPMALGMILRYPKSEFSGFCFFEYLSAMAFCMNWKKHKPDFSILFVNMLAHLQHYYWNGQDVSQNKKIMYGLKFIDQIILEIFSMLGPDDHFLTTNALSQKNTNKEPSWNSYRPIDHTAFLTQIGIRFERVEALMSYDANIEFSTQKERDAAQRIIDSVTTNSKPLFLTDRYSDHPTRLFYRLQYTDKISKDQTFSVSGNVFKFTDHFHHIAERTGKHISSGTFFSNHGVPDKPMMNHQICHWICELFHLEKSSDRQTTSENRSHQNQHVPFENPDPVSIHPA